jgi:hypothetical protein
VTVRTARAQPSPIEKLWKDIVEAYPDEGAEDDFLDRVNADEEFRDEFVRLPYEEPKHENACQW